MCVVSGGKASAVAWVCRQRVATGEGQYGFKMQGPYSGQVAFPGDSQAIPGKGMDDLSFRQPLLP